MRFASSASVVVAKVVLASLAAATSVHAQAVTTRIETRPYYGAITTIEHGVRVTRALPPHDRIIINPHGKANVSINVGGHVAGADGGPVINQHTHNSVAPVAPVYGGPISAGPAYAGPGYMRHVRPGHGLAPAAGHITGHNAGHWAHRALPHPTASHGAVRILRPNLGHHHR